MAKDATCGLWAGDLRDDAQATAAAFARADERVEAECALQACRPRETRGAFDADRLAYDGDIATQDLTAVTSAALVGLLGHVFDPAGVNFVNARLVARERGIEVVEAKSARAKDYANLVTVKVSQEAGLGHLVSGTLFGRNDPRIVRIDAYQLEALPEGYVLLIHNHDRPGVIGAVGTVLGDAGVNISRIMFHRRNVSCD